MTTDYEDAGYGNWDDSTAAVAQQTAGAQPSGETGAADFGLPNYGGQQSFDYDPMSMWVGADPVGLQQYDTAAQQVFGTVIGGQSAAQPLAGQAPAGDNQWTPSKFMQYVVGKAIGFFENDKTGARGAAALTVGASFLQGMLSAKKQERKLVADEKTADANMMIAQERVAENKRSQDNANSVAKLNFGNRKTGLLFQDKYAERRARSMR